VCSSDLDNKRIAGCYGQDVKVRQILGGKAYHVASVKRERIG
jgi:hypothetical protein